MLRYKYLLALGESSCDMLGALSLDFVLADVQTCHRPDGEKYIRGGTEDVLALTGTYKGRQPQS